MKRSISLEQAKAAKAKVSKLVGKHPDVTGIGVARIGRGFGVKLNLVKGTLADRVPREIDGVPVQVETVGQVAAQAEAARDRDSG